MTRLCGTPVQAQAEGRLDSGCCPTGFTPQEGVGRKVTTPHMVSPKGRAFTEVMGDALVGPWSKVRALNDSESHWLKLFPFLFFLF